MSAHQAVRDLVEVLRLVPEAAVPPAHVGSVTPGAPGDLPALVVTLTEAMELPLGIGGLDAVRRTGDAWSESGGARTKGVFVVEVYAADAARVETITGHVTGVLADPAHTLSGGFLALGVRALGATGRTGIGSGDDSAFVRTLEYAGLHEHVTTEDPGPGGVIARVRVSAHEAFHESFDIP